jgi:exosortase/archaeosortase family protein
VSRLLGLLAFAQEMLAPRGVAGPSRVAVTLDCSGADVMALCAGVLLAFPAPWARRLLAAAGSLAFVLLLNSVRIAVLERAAGSPAFDLLHLYLLPALLQLAAAGYVFGWMWWRRPPPEAAQPAVPWLRTPPGQFALWTLALLGLYALATPSLAASALIAAVGSALAASAAFLMNLVGASAQASGHLLATGRGSFAVTPECVLTPLLPVALGAAAAWPGTVRRRVLLALASLPFFAALSLARLLVLAAPPWLLDSPLFVAHGFRQGAVGIACITMAGLWGAGPGASGRGAWRRALLALLAAAAALVLGGPLLVRLLLMLAAALRSVAPQVLTELATPGDVQGALAVLPAYQLGLLVGLLVAAAASARRSALALVALVGSQLALLVAMGALAAHAVELPVIAVRCLAVAVPIALALLALGARGAPSYLRFWEEVGEQFPDLGGAASTDYYRANEIRLVQEQLGGLDGRSVLKTDLWDEARNTRILQWIHAQGARVFGIDISTPTLLRARDGFSRGGLRAAAADVRGLPYRDGCFDLVYSMGTIEHFTDSGVAAAEIFRVLKPGGRAIVGVPNRLDPFLRPLLVSLLSALGLYAYGYERSFTRRGIRGLLEGVGFQVVAEPAILFIPGWLRMLDLWCHCHCRPLAGAPAAAVAVFVWLDRHVPAVRRHGYLLATVVVRPGAAVVTSRPGPDGGPASGSRPA